MRRYINQNKEHLEICCNQCGRQILVKKDIPLEDIFHVEKTWGYFSKRDGKRQNWDLCEECYDRLIEGFALPPTEEDITEFM